MSAPESASSATSPFALSFERVTLESIAAPWKELEDINAEIQEKRRTAEKHAQVAADHLRAVSMINAEIQCLEHRFSSVMSSVVSERSRMQEKLRALVHEWERQSISTFDERTSQLQNAHSSEVSRLSERIARLERSTMEQQETIAALQLKNNNLQTMLHEYGLELSGPLMESLRARRLVLGKNGPADHATAANPVAPPNAPSVKSFIETETEELRGEVVRLQAELAASRAESRMRLGEVNALREASASFNAENAPALQPDHAFYHLSSRHSVASTSSMSANLMSASRQLFERTSSFQHHSDDFAAGQGRSLSIGMNLGTRRQQAGLPGVHVVDVVQHSPAAIAGIRSNDIVVSWNGKRVDRLEDIAAAVHCQPPDSALEIEFARPANSDALAPIDGSEVFTATMFVEGKLDGPHNLRRERYSSRERQRTE
jgi:uncharacterized protein YukE